MNQRDWNCWFSIFSQDPCFPVGQLAIFNMAFVGRGLFFKRFCFLDHRPYFKIIRRWRNHDRANSSNIIDKRQQRIFFRTIFIGVINASKKFFFFLLVYQNFSNPNSRLRLSFLAEQKNGDWHRQYGFWFPWPGRIRRVFLSNTGNAACNGLE